MIEEKVKATDTLRVYWNEARHYKMLLFFMVLSITAAKFIAMAVPLFYKKFFDTLAKTQPTPELAEQLLGIIIVVLLLNLVGWLSWRTNGFLYNFFQTRIITNITETAFAYLVKHSYGFFSNNFAGALTRRVRRLADAFERFADQILWSLYPLVIRIVSTTIILWTLNHVIALILLAWTIIFLLLNYFFAIWKLKYDTALATKDSETTALLSDNISNHMNLLLFSGIPFEISQFKKVLNSLRKLMIFTWTMDGVVEAIQTFLMVVVEFLIFYFAIKYWQAGTLTIGTFVVVQAYLLGLINDLWDFGRNIRAIYRSFADADEMVKIMKSPHEIKDMPKAKVLVAEKGEIVFSKVDFSFNRTRKILKNFNLTIRPGEKVAIVGPSGAGKSTVIKLLFRFYDIDGGKILIDGQNISRVSQESLRVNLSLVPQDPILFHRTLIENIRYGRRDASDEEVYRAARLANCHQFIEDLPNGYETFVGERGIKLSGGERQRVAIARAILKNAPILVLDEATSSLDSQSESLIQDALDRLMEGKTTIVIAHRLSTIKMMDRIVVIEAGQVVEEGTHDELIRKPKSLYKKLWKLQAGGFLQDGEE